MAGHGPATSTGLTRSAKSAESADRIYAEPPSLPRGSGHDSEPIDRRLAADRYLEHFDGFSIGSNDLTQLTLGVDRDSGIVAHAFDERDDAVKALLAMAIDACKRHGKYIGICGQGPSDHPDFARWLLEQGIDSLSLNPDTVLDTWLFLAKKPPPR